MKVFGIKDGNIANITRKKRVIGERLFGTPKQQNNIAQSVKEELLFGLGAKNDELLNYMYKHLPEGTERKLENFNGKRKISVYRGKNYMNKITQRLSNPPLTFIRSMENKGTAADPKLVTSAVSLRIPSKKEEIIIRVIDEGPDKDKLFLRVTETGFLDSHKAIYNNWNQLRQDNSFKRVLAFIKDQLKK